MMTNAAQTIYNVARDAYNAARGMIHSAPQTIYNAARTMLNAARTMIYTAPQTIYKVAPLTANVIRRHIAVALSIAVCFLASCDRRLIYHHYTAIAKDRWVKGDTLVFSVDTILHAGQYTTSVCMRTNASFPYRSISVRTVTTVYPAKKRQVVTSDVDVVQRGGLPVGNGITLFTTEQPVDEVYLQPGDSLVVKVVHNMRRLEMPGITDVGLKIERRE